MSRRVVKGRKRAALRLTHKLFNEALASGEVQTPAQMSNAIMRSVLIGVSVGMRGMGKPERMAGKAVRIALDSATETFATLIDESGDQWVLEMQQLNQGFVERLDERWGDGLRLCELMRIICLEVGMEHHEEQAKQGGAQHHVLAKLHAKACLIAGEVVALLRSGYASGAHARWRAMHEATVIGTFIADRDEDLAERYLEYEHVESLAAARDYQANAEDLNYEPFSDAEMAEMESAVDQLCQKYGSMFKKGYGWAAHVFGYAPNYKTIEQATDLSHYRSYYRMASHPVHAGPKGIAFDIGLLEQGKAMLAGPSNAGVADPGQGLCISLTQITAAFLNLKPAAGNVATLQVLLDLSERAGAALIHAHHQLAEDDARINEDEYPQRQDREVGPPDGDLDKGRVDNQAEGKTSTP